MSEDALDELKKRKKEQLSQGDVEGQMEQQREQVRQQLKQIASQILTKEARSRLANIRAAKPDFAAQVEMQLVQLYRAGQIKDTITDEQLKTLLTKIQEGRDEQETDIKYTTPRG